MFQRLDEVESRLEELDRQLMDPAVLRNPNKLREIGRERANVVPIVDGWRALQSSKSELAEAQELLDDAEMREMAELEIERLEELIPKLTEELKVLLLPQDPYEGRDIILEIRAGTGGDEAALFAADLFRMYARYCDEKRWKVEILSKSEINAGGTGGKSSMGLKEVICQISGADAYRYLKYESGVHRVQRVPVTETQGRIHTSAATVAFLPVAELVEVQIEEKDLRIDVYRSSGPGGQSVNTTDSAVRITHLETGIVVQCQDEKSQHKNKAKAMRVLAARLLERIQAEQDAEEAENRKAQVGSGDRSERIRTYNFPQNRLTDHRVGLTFYKLDQMMEGTLDELVVGVTSFFQAQAVADLSD